VDVGRLCAEAPAIVEMARAHAASYVVGVAPVRVRGIGLEWEDYRDYRPGDDTRLIDWRLSSRAIGPDGGRRLLIRERRAERTLEVVLALDASASMGVGEKLPAALYALSFISSLAASLGDRVTLLVFASGRVSLLRVPPASVGMAAVFELCRRSMLGGRVDLREVSRVVSGLVARRVSLVLITDLAHDPREFEDAVSALRSIGWGVGVIISSHQSEVCLPQGGSILLEDPEGGALAIKGVEGWRELEERLRTHRERVFSALRRWVVPHVEFTGLEGCRLAAASLLLLYRAAREGSGAVSVTAEAQI